VVLDHFAGRVSRSPTCWWRPKKSAWWWALNRFRLGRRPGPTNRNIAAALGVALRQPGSFRANGD